MAYDRKKISVCRCPECFAKEIDMALRYDERDDEYYCVKCCYTGTPDEIEAYFTFYKNQKYRAIFGPLAVERSRAGTCNQARSY